MESTGEKLRDLRTGAGLSQRALAKIVGVSNGTISVIENGEQDPTVGLLKRIIEGLGVSMSDFFGDKARDEHQYFFPKDELVDIGSGGIEYLQISHDLKGRAIQLIMERYAPGSDTGSTKITHEGEEGGFIISGRLEVSVGTHQRTLRAGDAYYFPSSLPHKFKNVGETPVFWFQPARRLPSSLCKLTVSMHVLPPGPYCHLVGGPSVSAATGLRLCI